MISPAANEFLLYLSIPFLLLAFIMLVGYYIKIKDMKLPNEFRLTNVDKVTLLWALIPMISFILMGVFIIIQSIMYFSEARWYVITGIIEFVFGIYILMCLIKILKCNIKSLLIDNNSQKFILKQKNSIVIELPYDSILEIYIKTLGIIRGIDVDIIKIICKDKIEYRIATKDAYELYEILPQNMINFVHGIDKT